MWRELSVFGVYLPPLAIYMLAALVLQVALRLALSRVRLSRWTWNPTLAEAGMYVCILALLVVLL